MAHSTTSNSQAHYIHYIEYQFDAQKRLKGAKLIPYLFDAGPTLGFPVFAMMMKELSGAEKSALKLKDTFSVPDTHADTRLMEIFETFGMKKKAKKGFLSTLAAIMHLGKIVFSSHLHTGLVYVQDTFHLDAAAELLGLPSSHLLDLLSHVNESTKKGHSSRSLSAQETSSQCQALSKLLYERLFSWLIDQINMKLCLDDSKWDSYIAILDIPSLQSNQTQFSRNESLLKYALEKLKVSIQVVERPKLEWERDGLQGLNLPVTRDNSLLKAFENSGSDILHQMDRNEFQDSGLVDRFRTLVLGDLERAGSNFKFMRRLFDTYSEDNPLSLSRSQKRVSSSKYTSQVSH